MEQLPLYIPIVFVATTLLTLFFLYRSSWQSMRLMVIAGVWLALQAGIGLSRFYTHTSVMPPRFLIAIGIPLLAILLVFLTSKGRAWMDSWDLRWLTWLHIVRIPVELVLFWLFLYKQVPQLMTFEGRNLDILSGITAPVIALLAFGTYKTRRGLLLTWNFLCLGLLINIVAHAILAAPFPFQRLAFDQPNVAVLYFPYVWLPAFIVPVVLLAHLVAIRRLLLKTERPL
jgi:hypothetical protein